MLNPNSLSFIEQKAKELKEAIQFEKTSFNSLAFDIFHFQKEHNKVYSQWLKLLKKWDVQPKTIEEIPFLPIELFKSHPIVTGDYFEPTIFKSSGTTQGGQSIHYVKDIDWYLKQSKSIFENAFFPLSDEVVIFALLPHYEVNGNSSLVAMVHYFIKESSKEGKFIPNDFQTLAKELKASIAKGKKVILFGVSYALLQFADYLKESKELLPQLMIFETGGMKGRGKELLREELHFLIKDAFGVETVYSEYGMTELLSQAYTNGGNLFKMNKYLKVLLRAIDNPLEVSRSITKGAINIIDLNNIDSCSFIATADQGSISNCATTGEQLFSVDGRLDNADIRGCNLLSLF